jgi:hypothetical protein
MMMGIGIPISQSKRPLPIVFSSLVCPENVRSEVRFQRRRGERTVEACLNRRRRGGCCRYRGGAPGSRSDALALAAATR